MGKSLREALAEHMGALRARGIAPESIPDLDELEVSLPTNGYNEEETRPRKLGKRALAKREPRSTAAKVAPAVSAGARHAPARAEGAAARPRPDGPVAAPRPPSIGKMLQRRAEQRRHEASQRDELRQQLSALRGEEADEQALKGFLSALERETGALPPLNVVLEAMREAGSARPEAVGDAVRRYYRRARR